MTTPERLSAILIAAYMLAMMWTIRAHGQAPPQPSKEPDLSAAPAEVTPAAADAARAATHARWLTASGGALLFSAPGSSWRVRRWRSRH